MGFGCRLLKCGLATSLLVYAVSIVDGKSYQSELSAHFIGRGSVESVHSLVERVIGVSIEETPFVLQIVADVPLSYRKNYEGNGYFLATNDGSHIRIMGSSGIDVAYGIGWYLRNYCNMSFSWERTGGNLVSVPPSWPKLGKEVFEQRGFPFSYFNNVCTFSYSYVWYRWPDWERWLDWAALSGMNLILAYTGQEELWRKTFKAFGVSNDAFAEWSNGEAFLTWSRGQSMHGISAPLSLNFMKGQWRLQRKILARMRTLGMIAVLPAFQGNLPPQMKELFPHSNMSLVRTGTGAKTCWLDCQDKLFNEIQAVYMHHLIQDFGTDHWYETDGSFDQTIPPWLSSNSRPVPTNSYPASFRPQAIPEDKTARAHSKAVYDSLQNVDKDAIWFYQGWIWRGWGADKLPYMKGWIAGVPRNKFVLLNMVDESPRDSIWSKFDNFSFFGAPFIWSVLHNFGGNVGMSGSLQTLNEEPFHARAWNSSVVGTGAAPEGIDQNPIYYQLLADINYRVTPFPSLESYVKQWTISRYGVYLPDADKAWALLLQSVYSEEANGRTLRERGIFFHEKNHDPVIALPLYVQPDRGAWYDVEKVKNAWKLLRDAAATFKADTTTKLASSKLPRTLNYDLVNVGREFLGKVGFGLYQTMTKGGALAKDVVDAGDKLINLALDMDDLLCTEQSFMAWPWIESARALAREYNDSEAKYVIQARSQPTTWSVPARNLKGLSFLHDYANKEWGGQMRAFYARRIGCYVAQATEQNPQSTLRLNTTQYLSCVARVSYEWTHDVDGSLLPICMEPTGDAIRLSSIFLDKYVATFASAESVVDAVQAEA